MANIVNTLTDTLGGVRDRYINPALEQGRQKTPPPQQPVPVTQTPSVQRSLTQMLTEDSPYMEQARQSGRQVAAQRGLLNTALAGQAAEGAAIQAAAPIVAQDVEAQQEERMLGMSTAANLQGQYTQATQSIMDNAAINISEIETAQNIRTEDKDKMIANTIARRDADLKFMKSFYNAMPVYQPNWTSLPSLPAAPGI